uniref:Reverse transcriptase domain-containing protein n=1 Tax=Steinernema glaseri TaxID=37863 RepID=A0A1I7XZF6_9BILA
MPYFDGSFKDQHKTRCLQPERQSSRWCRSVFRRGGKLHFVKAYKSQYGSISHIRKPISHITKPIVCIEHGVIYKDHVCSITEVSVDPSEVPRMENDLSSMNKICKDKDAPNVIPDVRK